MKVLHIVILKLVLLPLFCLAQRPVEPIYYGSFLGPQIVINNAIKVRQGTAGDLPSFHTLKINFEYEDMQVCEFSSLIAYLEHKNRKKGKEKAEEQFQIWNNNTKKQFEPRFTQYFNKKTLPAKLLAIQSEDLADLVLQIKFIWIEPHGHKAQNRLPYVYVNCCFKSNEGYIYLTYDITAFGSREPNDNEAMLDCYAVAGKMLGGRLVKDLNKAKSKAKQRSEEISPD